MLVKLLKYEFRATRRTMLPLLAAVAVVYALLMLMFNFRATSLVETNMGSEFSGLALAMFSFVVLVLNAVVTAVAVCMNVFVAFSRLRSNLLGDEGYLTNALPVTAGQKVLAKLITSVFWAVAAVAAVDIVTDIMSRLLENVDYSAFLFSDGRYSQNPLLNNLVGWGVFAVGVLFAYSIIFAGVTVGYSKNNHRLMKSVAVAVGLWIVSMLVDNITVTVFSYFSHERHIFFNFLPTGFNPDMRLFVLIKCLVRLAESVGLFFISRYYIGKKLNLQ